MWSCAFCRLHVPLGCTLGRVDSTCFAPSSSCSCTLPSCPWSGRVPSSWSAHLKKNRQRGWNMASRLIGDTYFAWYCIEIVTPWETGWHKLRTVMIGVQSAFRREWGWRVMSIHVKRKCHICIFINLAFKTRLKGNQVYQGIWLIHYSGKEKYIV